MKFSPEVGVGQRHNLLDFEVIRITILIKDPDYDLDPGSELRSGLYSDRTDFHAFFTRGVSRPNDQSIKFGNNPEYDLDLGH